MELISYQHELHIDAVKKLFTLGQYKSWTLDSGLDCGLDHGLDPGLNNELDFWT